MTSYFYGGNSGEGWLPKSDLTLSELSEENHWCTREATSGPQHRDVLHTLQRVLKFVNHLLQFFQTILQVSVLILAFLDQLEDLAILGQSSAGSCLSKLPVRTLLLAHSHACLVPAAMWWCQLCFTLPTVKCFSP